MKIIGFAGQMLLVVIVGGFLFSADKAIKQYRDRLDLLTDQVIAISQVQLSNQEWLMSPTSGDTNAVTVYDTLWVEVQWPESSQEEGGE